MATTPIGDVSELVNSSSASSEKDSNGESESNKFENSLSPEEKEELLCEIEKASKILCAGPTGFGKFTLLNGLIYRVQVKN